MVEIGSMIRVMNTENCGCRCINGCDSGHQDKGGWEGKVVQDNREAVDTGHYVICKTCNHREDMIEARERTGHFWVVFFNNATSGVFTTDELEDIPSDELITMAVAATLGEIENG